MFFLVLFGFSKGFLDFFKEPSPKSLRLLFFFVFVFFQKFFSQRGPPQRVSEYWFREEHYFQKDMVKCNIYAADALKWWKGGSGWWGDHLYIYIYVIICQHIHIYCVFVDLVDLLDFSGAWSFRSNGRYAKLFSAAPRHLARCSAALSDCIRAPGRVRAPGDTGAGLRYLRGQGQVFCPQCRQISLETLDKLGKQDEARWSQKVDLNLCQPTNAVIKNQVCCVWGLEVIRETLPLPMAGSSGGSKSNSEANEIWHFSHVFSRSFHVLSLSLSRFFLFLLVSSPAFRLVAPSAFRRSHKDIDWLWILMSVCWLSLSNSDVSWYQKIYMRTAAWGCGRTSGPPFEWISRYLDVFGTR